LILQLLFLLQLFRRSHQCHFTRRTINFSDLTGVLPCPRWTAFPLHFANELQRHTALVPPPSTAPARHVSCAKSRATQPSPLSVRRPYRSKYQYRLSYRMGRQPRCQYFSQEPCNLLRFFSRFPHYRSSCSFFCLFGLRIIPPYSTLVPSCKHFPRPLSPP
jgi:hypothetical protein